MAKSSKNSICLFLLVIFFHASLHINYLYASEKRTLDESHIKAAITNHIEMHMTWPKGSTRITFPSGIPEVPLSVENFTLEVKENKNDEFIGNRLYQVKIWHENHFYKQLSIPTLIEVCKDLVLSSRTLEKDRNISEQDIIVVKKWLSRLPQDLLTDPREIIGNRLLRSIKARSTFTTSMLSHPIMFKKGKIVKIVCDNDVLTISTFGLAEEEGTYGAIVRVKNISSNKIIHAKVVGDSTVKIEI